MNVIDISNRKAPTHHLPELPPMAELAERLRSGDTINAIATEYERTPRLIRSRLNKAGFASSGDATEPTPWPTREKLPSFWRPFERADWMEAGICGQADPEEFFPEHRAQGSIAKDICLSCPVREQCLAYALEHSEYGIWGATDDKDRRKLKKNRRASA